MTYVLHVILTLLCCYVLGSLLFGLIIAETVYGTDIREYGSGNVGFTNIKRVLGWRPAVVVLLLDGLKGAVAIWIGRRVFHKADPPWNEILVLLGGILAIVGHNWSCWARFAGGKGVATSLGVLFGLDYRVGLLALAVGVPFLFYPGYMSLACIIGTVSVPLWFWLLHDPPAYVGVGIIMLVFVLVRHRANIQRLRNGEEPKFSFRGSATGATPPEIPTPDAEEKSST